jgi:hypothetical protein
MVLACSVIQMYKYIPLQSQFSKYDDWENLYAFVNLMQKQTSVNCQLIENGYDRNADVFLAEINNRLMSMEKESGLQRKYNTSF